MATEAPVLARPLALHVSGLDPSTTEVDLYQFIAETQVPVQSIRIIRDETAKVPRYAYVNFSSVEDSEKVLRTLNYRMFKNREVFFSHSIPPSQNIPHANLHIAGLPENTTSEILANSLASFGPIVSARVGVSKDGTRYSYGFVQFFSDVSANAVVEAAAAGPIKIGETEANVQVNVFKPLVGRVGQQTNVFIRNFPSAKGEQAFLDTAKQFGNVTSFQFKADCLNVAKTGPSETGFGFANYETPEQAQSALVELNKLQIDGFPIQAFFSKNRLDRQRELAQTFRSSKANIYVKHIHPDMTDEAVEEALKSFGPIISLKLVLNEAGTRTGVAHVQYVNPTDASAAIRQCHARGWYAAIFRPQDQRNQRSMSMYGNRPQYRNYMRPPRRQGKFGHYQQRSYPVYQQQQQQPHDGRMYHPRTMNYGMRPPRQQYYDNGAPHHMHNPRQFHSQNNRRFNHHGAPQHQFAQQRQQQQQHQHQQQPQQPQPVSVEEQRQKLGEELYWKVEPIDATQAPQITGMLLDMPVEEVYTLLKNPQLLAVKVQEAQELLSAPQAQ